MVIMIDGRRFTLLNPALCARIEDLAKDTHCPVVTYLSELMEMHCYERKLSLAHCPENIDPVVSLWIEKHRSGKAPERTPHPAGDGDSYALPRGISFLETAPEYLL